MLTMRRAGTLLLAVWLPVVTPGQTRSAVPWSDAADSPQDEAVEATEPTQGEISAEQAAVTKVDPALLKKKVAVHLRDGRVHKGKLVEITEDSLQLKTNGATQQIALTEIVFIERQKSRNWIPLTVLAGAVGAVLIIYVLAVSSD